jgi:EmrB/QacA subfamily drug resistance transporter
MMPDRWRRASGSISKSAPRVDGTEARRGRIRGEKLPDAQAAGRIRLATRSRDPLAADGIGPRRQTPSGDAGSGVGGQILHDLQAARLVGEWGAAQHSHVPSEAHQESQGTRDPDPRGPRIGRRRGAALVVVAAAVTLVVMDGSIVNVALPTLVRALGGASNGQLQWIVDAYILAFATLLLTMGNAADRFGRRRVLVLGAIVFGATSLGAAFSTRPESLVLWRAAMGVGAAMIFPSTLAILTHAFPEPALRRMAIGVWAACSGLGVAIGPVAGGWILRHFEWGAIFLANAPLAAAIVAGALLSIDESSESDRGPIDAKGNLIAIAALLAFVWSLIEAPERGWTSPWILAGLGSSVVLSAAFIRRESRVAHPMLDLKLIGSRDCAIACLAIAAAFFGLFGFVFMVTQFLQFVRGHDALEAGIRTLPFAGAIVVGAAIVARFGRRVAPRWIVASGLALMSVGFAWALVDRIDTAYGVLAGQMCALGVGLGLVSAAATEVVMESLASDRLGLASSLNDTARELGGTLGVAAMGSVFNAIYRSDVRAAFEGSPLPEAAQDAVRQSLGVALEVAGKVSAVAGSDAASKVRVPAIEAFIAGFHASSLVAAGLAAIGALVVVIALRRPATSVDSCAGSPETDLARARVESSAAPSASRHGAPTGIQAETPPLGACSIEPTSLAGVSR